MTGRTRVRIDTGVPCFTLDGRAAIPGVVEPGVFLHAFEKHGIGAGEAGTG